MRRAHAVGLPWAYCALPLTNAFYCGANYRSSIPTGCRSCTNPNPNPNPNPDQVEYADRLPQLHRHFMPGQLHVPDFVVFFDDVDDRPPPPPHPILTPTPTP